MSEPTPPASRWLRLRGTFTLRSPLSHIGESISTITYLSEDYALQPDGSIEEVFCYNGNAWRGQLRDLAAAYMLDRLGVRIPLDAFHMLFSGGRIGGEQSINVERARTFRRAIPMIALWGSGVGNQMLPGKLRVENSYPLCWEALPMLPPEYRERAATISYRGMTFLKSFTRMDDGKNDHLRVHLAGAERDGLPAGDSAQPSLLGGGAPTEPSPRGKAKPKDGPADQMRMTSELLAPGVVLVTEITAENATEVELGCLVSALHRFSRSPHIGGQSGRGHGLVSLHYDYLDLDTGETGPFLTIDGGPSLLSPVAAAAQDAYDEYLRQAYDAMLAREGDRIGELLLAGGA